ncbi:MAG: SRPBCC family protein [Actinobacteria bacterium]|jgi:carbon monoxide dehydrogenase subunit G|nr:SRPBCC family protein [Actinomycetota bacterium]
MQFENAFEVPADPDTTFATLTDLEKVAPCLPGAVLEEVDGDVYTGHVKVKVGPMQMTYRGTARLVEVDADARSGRIEAAGREARGSGTAAADVTASVVPHGTGSLVTVVTDLKVTGKPAQFGRGVMAEVGTKIIDAFADRLRAMLTEAPEEPAPMVGLGDGEAEAPSQGAQPGAEQPTVEMATPRGGPRIIESRVDRDNDALDLMDVAGAATMKRLVPLVAAIVVIALVVWWLVAR